MILIGREALFFPKNTVSKPFKTESSFKLFFFQVPHHIFENKYFRGITMALSRVVLYKLMVRKVKTHFKMRYRFLSYRKLLFQ